MRNKLKLSIILMILLSSFYVTAAATPSKLEGKVFSLSDKSKHTVSYQREMLVSGDTRKDIVVFLGADKSILVKETSIYQKDNSLKQYSIEQKQVSCRSEVTRDGDKYKFVTVDKSNKKTERIISNSGRVVTGDGVSQLIVKEWSSLMVGKPVQFHLIVACLNDLLSLKITKSKDRELQGKSFVVLEVSASDPANPKKIVSSFFYFDKQKKLSYYEGSIPVILDQSKADPRGIVSFL